MPIRTFTSLLFTCLLAVSTTTQAKEPDWYQIEVLIFAQQSDYQRSNELWRDNFTPDYSADPITLSSSAQANIARQPFLSLPADLRKLNASAQRIRKAPDLRLLSHLAWRQPVMKKDEAQPILIQTGDRFDSSSELEGTLTIYRGRYLHASSDLFFSQFKSVDTEKQLDWSVFSEDKPVSDSDAWLQSQQQNQTANFQAIAPDTNAQFIRAATARLKQSRRMRSDELHYIDHPLFGMLVQITPYKKPDPARKIQEIKLDRLPEKRPLPSTGGTS